VFTLPNISQVTKQPPPCQSQKPSVPVRDTTNLRHFDFEQPTLNQNGLYKVGSAPVVSTDRSFTGANSLQSYLNYNHRNYTDRTHENFRSEVGIQQTADSRWTSLQYNQQQWFGFAVLLDESEYTEPQFEHIIFKILSVPDPAERRRVRHPIFTLGITGVKDSRRYGLKQPTWRFSIVGDSQKIIPPVNKKRYQSRNSGTAGAAMIDRGRWVRWVINIKTSYNPDGFLKVWKDGRQVYTKVGIRTAFNDEQLPYIRIGQYNWNWRPTLKISRSNPAITKLYIDDLRFAYGQDRYRDVVP
jgi:hypothetical protein